MTNELKKEGTELNPYATTVGPTASKDSAKEKVFLIWARFEFLYGHRWSSRYQDNRVEMMAKKEWATSSVVSYGVDIISAAIDIVKERMPNPPFIAEFVAICKEVFSKKGISTQGHFSYVRSEWEQLLDLRCDVHKILMDQEQAEMGEKPCPINMSKMMIPVFYGMSLKKLKGWINENRR